MSRIELGFGPRSIRFEYDPDRFEVLTVAQNREQPLSDFEIGLALDSPIESEPLEELINSGDSVLIVVSDATRATASAQVVNLLARRLIQFGVAAGDIAIIFATGIHRAVTESEKSALLTPFIAKRIRTIDHNPHGARWLHLGDLPCGTPIEINTDLREYTHVIVTGGIGFHYFAGFTGGRKSICPGLASAKTIEATHMLALDFEHGGRRVGVGPGFLDGNAVHEACEQIASLISPSFGINAIVNEAGRAVRIYAGNWRAAHRLACEDYLRDHQAVIPTKRALVIASCGGLPWDINMIQAHKTLDMAAQACDAGGTIVLLAQCSDGLGRTDFLRWFKSPDSAALEAQLREHYEVNGQTAWSLMVKAEAFRIFVLSGLPEGVVQEMRLTAATDLAEVMNQVAPGTKGFILPRGAVVLPVLSA